MNNLRFWISLEQTHGIGPAHLLEIYEKLQANELAIRDLLDLNENEIIEEFKFHPKLSRAIVNSKNNLDKIEQDYFSLLDRGIEIIPFFSEKYPKQLKNSLGHSFPPFLYTFGNREILKMKGIALLGDKNVSSKGELISYMGAKILTRHKIALISGLAAGADMAAHRSAIENMGHTIAVVPYGMNHLKLPDFLGRLDRVEQFLIISPFYPTKEANKFNAFIRNKIICAMSNAVFIVESPRQGGIFEAAKSAYNLKIPLFTAQYSEYPENAKGNKIIMEKFKGIPVKGKMENNLLVPNLDRMIGIVKFEK